MNVFEFADAELLDNNKDSTANILNNPITNSRRRLNWWIKTKLLVNLKDSGIVSFTDTETKILPSTIMAPIYLRAPRNNNGIIEIFTNIIFRDIPERINYKSIPGRNFLISTDSPQSTQSIYWDAWPLAGNHHLQNKIWGDAKYY